MVFVTNTVTKAEAKIQESKGEIVRVVLADDHVRVRTAIRKLINLTSDLVVVGEADNGVQTLELVERLAPDVLILDMEMPLMNGSEVAARLKENRSPVKILAVSAHDDRQYILGLLENGASGYMTKDEAPEILVTAVRGVAQGKHGWVSQRVARLLSDQKSASPANRLTLTNREMEILMHVADQMTDAEIARDLNMDQRLVERHIHLLGAKFGARSRTELIVRARQERNTH